LTHSEMNCAFSGDKITKMKVSEQEIYVWDLQTCALDQKASIST